MCKTPPAWCKFGFGRWVGVTDGSSELGAAELARFGCGLRRDVSPRRVTRMRQECGGSAAPPCSCRTQLLPPAAARKHSPVPARPSVWNLQSVWNSANPPGPQHDDRLPLSASRCEGASARAPPTSRKPSSGEGGQPLTGEGAWKPGRAGGTRRHLTGGAHMLAQLLGKCDARGDGTTTWLTSCPLLEHSEHIFNKFLP